MWAYYSFLYSAACRQLAWELRMIAQPTKWHFRLHQAVFYFLSITWLIYLCKLTQCLLTKSACSMGLSAYLSDYIPGPNHTYGPVIECSMLFLVTIFVKATFLDRHEHKSEVIYVLSDNVQRWSDDRKLKPAIDLVLAFQLAVRTGLYIATMGMGVYSTLTTTSGFWNYFLSTLVYLICVSYAGYVSEFVILFFRSITLAIRSNGKQLNFRFGELLKSIHTGSRKFGRFIRIQRNFRLLRKVMRKREVIHRMCSSFNYQFELPFWLFLLSNSYMPFLAVLYSIELNTSGQFLYFFDYFAFTSLLMYPAACWTISGINASLVGVRPIFCSLGAHTSGIRHLRLKLYCARYDQLYAGRRKPGLRISCTQYISQNYTFLSTLTYCTSFLLVLDTCFPELTQRLF